MQRNDKFPAFRRNVLKIGRVDVPFYVPINNAYREVSQIHSRYRWTQFKTLFKPFTKYFWYQNVLKRQKYLKLIKNPL